MPSPPRHDDEGDATIIGKIAKLPLSTRRDRAHLIVLAGESLGQMFRVDGSEIIIGRAAAAAIRLQDDGVSRRHARIVQAGGELHIESEKGRGTTVTLRLGASRVLAPAAAIEGGDKDSTVLAQG